MRFRSTLLLLLLVLLGAALVLFLEQRTPSTDEIARRSLLALDLQPERIEALQIQTTNYLVACRRQGEGWLLTTPVTARADTAAIDRLLSALEEWPRIETLRASELRKRKLSPAEYGLETPRVEISWTDPSGTHTFRIGRDSPLGDALYLQRDRETDVLVASTNFWQALPATADDFRSRTLFEGSPRRVVRLELKRPEGFLRLVRSAEGDWTLQQPDRGPADPSFVLDLLDALHESRVLRFVSDQPGDKAPYGLDAPRAEITVSGPDDVLPQVLSIGDDVEGETNTVYARLGDPGPIVTVDRDLLEAALLNPNVLRARRLLEWAPDAVAYLEIRAADEVLTLERTAGTNEWWVTRPVRRKARSRLVEDLITSWCNTSIREFVADDVTNFSEYALSPPVFRITFATAPPPPPVPAPLSPETPPAVDPATSPPPRSVSIGLGNVVVEQERLFVRREDMPSVFEVDLAMLQRLSVSPTFYFDPEVLRLDPDTIRSLALERNGTRQVIERGDDGTFQPSAENGAPGAAVLPGRIAEILDALQSLRAVQFVATAPNELEAYGLTTPYATLTLRFREETGISQSILFGGLHETVGRYTTIRGQDIVFVLPTDTCERLLSDLYSPAAPPPDGPADPPAAR